MWRKVGNEFDCGGHPAKIEAAKMSSFYCYLLMVGCVQREWLDAPAN